MLSEQEARRVGLVPGGAAKQPRKRARPSKAGEGLSEPSPYRCHECGRVFASYAAADRHLLAEHGHGRLEAVLAEVPPPGGYHTTCEPGDDGTCQHCGRTTDG